MSFIAIPEDGKVTFGSQEKRIERLLREIAAARNSIANDIAVLKAHPTYGRTKTGIRARIAELEGMLLSWAIVTGRWDKPAKPLSSDVRRMAEDVLGISVDALAAGLL